MNLSFSEIRALTLGAVRVTEESDGIHFYRFTEAQEARYKERNEEFYIKTFSTSGVRLRFRTDSPWLNMKALLHKCGSRSYFSFDLFINGKRTDTLDNFSNEVLPEPYVTADLPQGEFAKTFDLGTGEKEICLYFPWSAKAVLQEFSLKDGAFIEPVKPARKMLCLGDSITMGMDALHPSCKYASQLADFLDAEEYNKGISGEKFFPGLAAEEEPFMPDIITVAYGTNDWGKDCTREEMEKNCRGVFGNLRKNYPDTPIYAITPLWRRIWEKQKLAGPFSVAEEVIRAVAEELGGITVIPGFDLIPHRLTVFGDHTVHPNDEGFTYYFESLKMFFE